MPGRPTWMPKKTLASLGGADSFARYLTIVRVAITGIGGRGTAKPVRLWDSGSVLKCPRGR